MIKDQYGVRWRKEIDPDMRIRAGTMDCTRWVPEKPWWDGQIVENVNNGIQYILEFEVPEGETPIMGRNYMKKIPSTFLDNIAEYVWEEKERVNKDVQKLKNYWHGTVLPTVNNFKYKFFEKPYVKIKITK